MPGITKIRLTDQDGWVDYYTYDRIWKHKNRYGLPKLSDERSTMQNIERTVPIIKHITVPTILRVRQYGAMLLKRRLSATLNMRKQLEGTARCGIIVAID